PAVRGPRGEAGRDAQRVATAGRRGLDVQRPPGRPVGQDRSAEGLPRAGHLGRGAAPGRDAEGRHHHRREHRPRGADLRRGALRRGRRPVRRGRGARAALRVTPPVAAEKTREVFWGFGTLVQVLWYVLAFASVAVFAYGIAREVAKYRRG